VLRRVAERGRELLAGQDTPYDQVAYFFSEVFGTVSPSKFTNILLREGDEVLIQSPGGGGYGDPHERDPQRIAEDVAQGFVSESAAREIYGAGS